MTTTGTRILVLIVEDDVMLRRAAVEMVEEAGFDALEAENSLAAMQLLEAVQGIRILLTDIDMPSSIDGIKLAACVHRRWPQIGIIITSGKVIPRLGDVPGQGQYFAKPYDEAALVAAMHRLGTR